VRSREEAKKVCRGVRIVKHVDTRVRGGGVVSNKQIRISTSPVILTHSKKGTATVVGKVKGREKCE
jgi:hypothetical protein